MVFFVVRVRVAKRVVGWVDMRRIVMRHVRRIRLMDMRRVMHVRRIVVVVVATISSVATAWVTMMASVRVAVGRRELRQIIRGHNAFLLAGKKDQTAHKGEKNKNLFHLKK